jgi:SAM-dependent methyltransferase
MIALYLKSTDDPARGPMLERIAKQLGRAIDPASVVTMTPNSNEMRVALRDRGAERSWLTTWLDGQLAAIGFSPTLRPFRGAWGAAMVDRLSRSLRKDGVLLMPVLAGAEAKGWWTQEWLTTTTGTSPLAIEPEWLVYPKGPGNTTPSVLRWFFEDSSRVILDLMHADKISLASLESQILPGPSAPRVIPQNWDATAWARAMRREAREGDEEGAIESEQSIRRNERAMVASLNYAIGGVNYKAGLLQHFITKLIGNRSGLSTIDVGGGTGVVAAELLLGSKVVDHAINAEPQTSNALLGQLISHRFPERMAGRFGIASATAEVMAYDRSHDLISFLGSLLYVPRDHTKAVLRGAWDRLKPGGLLVIHENIKRPSYTRDFEYMFTVTELEELLAEFGKPTYWLSTATAQIDPGQVAEKSVFRVLQKA